MGGKYCKKLQKQVVFNKTTCFFWSEMGDSNSRHLAPKELKKSFLYNFGLFSDVSALVYLLSVTL